MAEPKRVDLFADDNVFNLMTTAADKTAVDFEHIHDLEKKRNINYGWTGYDKTKELSDILAAKGIKLRQTPSILKKASDVGLLRLKNFTIGNTIYIDTESKFIDLDKIIRDEIPHVQQYREEGTLPFLFKYGKEFVSNILESEDVGVESLMKAQEKMYDTKGMEGFHSADPEEKERLVTAIGLEHLY